MTKPNIFLLFLLLPLTMRGQEDISIGKKEYLYSTVLQEQRNYWVHAPENYQQDTMQTYPVIYLLDGENYFHALVGINKTLRSGREKRISSCIIVGIVNTDRTRDLTPTASAAGRDGKIPPGATIQGGGAETFHLFLTQELRNTINSNYRTNGQHILVGHSYGGLFTLHTFLKHTDSFDMYLALDPSLWWDQGRLSQEAEEVIKGKDFTGKSLYVGVATQKRSDRTDIHHATVNYLLDAILPQAENLHYFTKAFPEENHGTVVIPGMYDGIKQLFGK
ncbi:MAG: alpha/beta hydrolase [Candidatus Azobacteroides sp.]|nr:alpha/beta hydrolase [Candidatus Azobacteroides sp.]